jgi:hypothetical protein
MNLEFLITTFFAIILLLQAKGGVQVQYQSQKKYIPQPQYEGLGSPNGLQIPYIVMLSKVLFEILSAQIAGQKIGDVNVLSFIVILSPTSMAILVEQSHILSSKKIQFFIKIFE